jgi:hypothetical protein
LTRSFTPGAQIFIKSPRVLRARVHPVTFQLYKSFWVFVMGSLFIAARAARGVESVFELNAWAFASAAAWIPAGLLTIVSVPLIGVSSNVLLTAATGLILHFLVFWLVFHEVGPRHVP